MKVDFMDQAEFDKLGSEEQKRMIDAAAKIREDLKANGADKPLKQLTMKELENTINTTVEKLLKPLTKVDRKFFALPGTGLENLTANPTAEQKHEKTIKFLNALVGKDVEVCSTMSKEVYTKANLSEGQAVAGGFLVPEEFAKDILRIAEDFGVIRREARHIPMLSDVLSIPAAGSTRQSAIWADEGGDIKQTNPNFREVQLTLKKLGALPVVTNELLKDASINTIAYLSELIAESFAEAEDIQGFSGVGSPFIGMLNATGAPTYPHIGGTGFETLSYQDLVILPSRIKSSVAKQAKYYFHRSILAHILSRITTTGAPIFDFPTSTLFGRPLVETEVLQSIGTGGYRTANNTYAIFGDVKRGLLMGERGTVEMKLSTEATVNGQNLFEQDKSALRVIERVSFGVGLPSAFVKISTNA